MAPCLGGPELRVKASITYSKEWVRSARRMTASSNQVSYVVLGLVGRFFVDALRPLLTGSNLSRFTLEEATSTKLGGATCETIRQQVLNELWAGSCDVAVAVVPPTHPTAANNPTRHGGDVTPCARDRQKLRVVHYSVQVRSGQHPRVWAWRVLLSCFGCGFVSCVCMCVHVCVCVCVCACVFARARWVGMHKTSVRGCLTRRVSVRVRCVEWHSAPCGRYDLCAPCKPLLPQQKLLGSRDSHLMRYLALCGGREGVVLGDIATDLAMYLFNKFCCRCCV